MASEIPTCSCPGCDQPGINQCSACKEKVYCGPICQTADWANHKEECEGHLLKVGNAHRAKGNGFLADCNFVQALRYGDLALAKLNSMKKRNLENISDALAIKCDALKEMNRYAESLQCAKDKYNMWAIARGPVHPFTILAAFTLIECLFRSEEYEDAHTYAHALWEIIHTNNHVDNDIPADKREAYVAMAAFLLSQAIYWFSMSGGIPPEEKQKAGEEAIARARQSLEIRIQENGAGSLVTAPAMVGLADVLSHFNDTNEENEVLRLFEQSLAIFTRINGRLSMNAGIGESKFADAYIKKSKNAFAANELDQCVANLKLALPHFREAAQIFRGINCMDKANQALSDISTTEMHLRLVTATRAASRG